LSNYSAALQKMLSDADKDVRAAARTTLSHLDRAAVAWGSLDILAGDDIPAKLQVITALSDVVGRRASEVLARVLKEDPQEDCRAAAARRLQEPKLAGREPALMAAATDSSLAVRLEVARGLGTVGGRDAVEALVGLLEDEPAVAVEALASLARLRAVDALPALVKCLKSPAPDVRAAAAAALGQIGDERSAGDLLTAFEDPEPQVRLAAVRAIAELPLPEELIKDPATTPPPR